jgi:hypothetical protein
LEGERLESGESAASSAVTLFGALFDFAAINAHEPELARDEETMGEYQQDYRRQSPGDVYLVPLPSQNP